LWFGVASRFDVAPLLVEVGMSTRKTLGYDEITRLLPHRAPMLLVDRVHDYTLGEKIHASKCVSSLDPFFAGHFPGEPIFPGVLLIEGMAQAGGLLLLMTFKHKGDKVANKCILTSVEGAKFRRPVVPGDVVHFHVKHIKKRGTFIWFSGEAKVDDEVVAEAKFGAMFFKQD
jgi:3-hydroxyacyl-[acyl-carrier-protein] dehydratase